MTVSQFRSRPHLFSALAGTLLLAGAAIASPQDAPPAAAEPTTPPAPAAPAPDLPAAKDLIDKHIAALGGKDAIAQIVSARYKGALDTPMGKMDLEIVTKRGGKILFRQGLGDMGTQEFGCDGSVGWATSPMSPEPQLLTDEMVAEAAEGADLQSMVRNVGDRFKDFTVVGREAFQGADAFKVKMAHQSGQAMNGFFDATTGLLRGLQIEADTPQGPMLQTMVFSDWEKVGPVQVFKTMSIEQMGMTMTMRFTDFEFNAVDDSVFKAPDKVLNLKKAKDAAAPAAAPNTPADAPPATR
jgi:hypothetical protein